MGVQDTCFGERETCFGERDTCFGERETCFGERDTCLELDDRGGRGIFSLCRQILLLSLSMLFVCCKVLTGYFLYFAGCFSYVAGYCLSGCF